MNKIRIIKKCAFIFFIAIILLYVIIEMIKYDVEGEKFLPFEISKILVISTIDGNPIDDEENIWNIELKQSNDLYLYITKNDNTNESIKKIKIDNFNIIKSPNRGEVAIYRPTGDLENLYTYSEQNYISDELTFIGSRIDDLKTLEISNDGGVIAFRVSLDNLGSYISNELTEISYDGSLLKNININIDDISFTLSFDISIETNSNIIYQGNIKIDLPAKDLLETSASNFEITDFSDVIFKRI